LTTADDSRIIALVRQAPPGRLERRADELVARDEEGSAQWSLDALAQAAQEVGIAVKRSQIRRIYLREGVRWRHTHSWGDSSDPDFVRNPNGGRLPLHSAAPGLDDGSRTDELGPVVPRTFPPAPGWSPTGHRIKAVLDYSRGPEKTWVYGALRVRDGKELTRCAASRNSKNYIALLTDIEAENPTSDIYMITDNLSSHNSLETRTWLEAHPRLHHVFIPTGARLSQPARGLVAALPPRCPGRAKLCQPRRHRASHSRCHGSTQPSSQAVDLGTPSQVPSPSSPSLLLPYLRNTALNSADAVEEQLNSTSTAVVQAGKRDY
jgi:hypothetical protein